jgi:hypothetical protein
MRPASTQSLLPGSNVTALEEGVGGSIDGMLSTSASEYPKSFALSAALDPGGCMAGCVGWWAAMGLSVYRAGDWEKCSLICTLHQLHGVEA